MNRSTEMFMFKDMPSTRAAMDLERELKGIALKWVRFTREKHADVGMALQAFENRGRAIIRKMLKDINPEVLGNIRSIDEWVIWTLYCRLLLRNNPAVETDFFKLLITLNKNPRFDSMRT